MFRSKNREETPSQRLVPILIAETVESRTALSGQELLLPVLPFRVGHEDRHLSTIAATYLDPKERRNPGRNPNNDLYLPEAGGQKYISRQHFLIHRDSKGRYFVLDRGSTLGTLVGGKRIGGRKKWGKINLNSGDLIIPGGRNSPFQFRFQLRPAQSMPLPKLATLEETLSDPN